MDIRVFPVGGFNEVGKNMTAVQVDDEIVIFDMGFFLPKLISFEEEGGDRRNLTPAGLKRLGAIPDDTCLDSLKDKVKAIVASHCHLDHIGAIPYLAEKYNCPVIGSPYTLAVLKTLLKDERIRIPNEFVELIGRKKYKISKNLEVELLHVTHSTPHTVLIVVHTREGAIVYGNDFKLDNNPVLWDSPDYRRMKSIGNRGVKALIMDTLYAGTSGKTPSEMVAREMLKDVMLGTHGEGHAMIVTTFASQLARLHSAIEFGRKLNRKVIMMGRSMHKYVTTAEKVGLVSFSKNVEILGYARQVEKKLKEIEKRGRDKYLILCTGNQAEPGAILTRMSTGSLPFKFVQDDHVIFSTKTIPVTPNLENRRLMEDRLKKKKARLFLDVHASGHIYREDMRDMLKIFKPENVIPCQGTHEHMKGLIEMCEDMGYKLGKTVHMLNDSQALELK
ncbi:RNase J family beta-CASP ribonuclease [Candidatus Woesearchaeota archaeon]|jgi:ribonuclease J|nr:RNase J family beta-CASP ribonuclease [Candidatus Woesearchaeota archaeon]MBT4321630.1 RNase J family beta-CASP ribonuclease [Candidatus Woesearchaeota archaeon]MBT4631059.1 RNase J family beta-CASP ribonuclease [Candidatus Woesearchaeota archaeon]